MKIKVVISVIMLFVMISFCVRASGYDYQKALETLSVSGTSAEGCVLYCLDTNEVVYASNERKRLPMASTTKIMTAVIVLERAELDDIITVDRSAVGVEGSSAYLMKDERISIKDLLYAMMLESANDAAVALALSVGDDMESFVAMMNDKASEIGLNDTHFDNPHGLDGDSHYSSAYDMALLCDYAMENSEFAAITGSYRYETDNRLFVNHNRLLKTCNGIIGGKTGFTKKSGRCLVSVARRDGVTMCAVTLNDPNDWKDHASLYDAAFDMFETTTLKGGEFNIPVINGTDSCLVCVAPDTDYVCKKGIYDSIDIRVCHDRFLYAPLHKGDTVGYLVYSVNGTEIARTDIKASQDITQIKNKSFIERIISFIYRN